MDGWMDGWMDVEAGLRIAYSNQKFQKKIKILLTARQKVYEPRGCAVVWRMRIKLRRERSAVQIPPSISFLLGTDEFKKVRRKDQNFGSVDSDKIRR